MRESRTLGSVRAKAERLSYSTCAGLTERSLWVKVLSDQSRSGQVGTESCGRRGNAGSEA